MASNNEDRGRSRRPHAEDCGWSHRSGTRWSNDGGSGDALYDLHPACGDEEHRFLG
jgi:hypothetical protein